METEDEIKPNKFSSFGLLVLALITIVYLVMLFTAKEQISSPMFEVLIGSGVIVLGMLSKFFLDIRKSK